MNQFLFYSGIILWVLVLGFIIIRLIYGKQWQRKIVKVFILGPGLLNASKKLANELPNKVKKETLAEVGTYAFMRLTRLGIIGIMIAIIPIALLWIQNNKINDQNYLIESQRRSSLVLLMNNILTDLSKEIEVQRTGISKDSLAKLDSIGYQLSQPLIGRIASLSQGLLPYRFLVEGKLTEKEYSIERGQLLLALINSNLDSLTYCRICETSTFQSSYLRNAKLFEADLFRTDLGEADLGEAALGEAALGGANLGGANLRRANLRRASLSGANLSGANLVEADLGEAALGGANLSRAYLSGANLSRAYLSGANLGGAYLGEANLSGANLWEAIGLQKDQLLVVFSLYDCKDVPKEWEDQLKKEKPCLFAEKGCSE